MIITRVPRVALSPIFQLSPRALLGMGSREDAEPYLERKLGNLSILPCFIYLFVYSPPGVTALAIIEFRGEKGEGKKEIK